MPKQNGKRKKDVEGILMRENDWSQKPAVWMVLAFTGLIVSGALFIAGIYAFTIGSPALNPWWEYILIGTIVLPICCVGPFAAATAFMDDTPLLTTRTNDD